MDIPAVKVDVLIPSIFQTRRHKGIGHVLHDGFVEAVRPTDIEFEITVHGKPETVPANETTDQQVSGVSVVSDNNQHAVTILQRTKD